MRRSVEEESDSEKSSDEETHFKRRRSKKGRQEANEDQDQVDANGHGLDSRHWDNLKSRAVANLRRSLIDEETISCTVSVSTSNNNGVKAIRCPVITRKPRDEELPLPPTSPKEKTVMVIPCVSSSTFTAAPETNGERDVEIRGGLTFRSSATNIMKQMGFDRSKGLGKTMNACEVDIASIEEVEKKVHEAGIVVESNDLDLNEEIPLEENVQWIKPVFPMHSTDYATLSQWMIVGNQKSSLHDEQTYVDPKVLKDVLAMKKCFEGLYNHDYQQIRARSNPFEALGKGPFLCRAALKMANLDFVLSHALTQPTTNSLDKVSAVGPNELFYFADVCAGPGGFSEYILCQKKWECKGFGMTLRGKLDFDLYSSTVANPENFETFYGPAGDGDVYKPENTIAFINYVRGATDGRGVHLMMADGGFDVEDKELQEIASARIYLSQCYLALSLVRTGGMFVCKLFDSLTPFTVGLIYLMYISFDLVCLHKPSTSRPANSERYLICKWKRLDTDGICSYLGSCYKWYSDMQSRNDRKPNNVQDILELVPADVINANKDFYDYICQSNTRIAKQQVEYLKKMTIFLRDPTLRDPRQEKLKAKLFEAWKISQFAPKKVTLNPERAVNEILGSTNGEFLQCSEYSLLEHNVEMYIRSPYDWRIVVVGGTQQEYNRGFYMSMGRDRVYRYQNKSWVRFQQRLELTKGTLVYGEFVDEVHGKKPNQIVIPTFHIIDAMFLGGTDVRAFHYTARLEVCIKFAKSMNKPSAMDLCQVRAKIPVRMENIADVFDRLENRVIAGSGTSSHLVCPVDHTDETLPVIKPAGILFLKITKDPWTMWLSKSANRKYYYNALTKESTFDLVPHSVSEFDYTMQHRMIWWWDKELKTVLSTQDVTDTSRPVMTSQGVLNPQRLLQFINTAWEANRTAVMRRLSSSSSSQGSS